MSDTTIYPPDLNQDITASQQQVVVESTVPVQVSPEQKKFSRLFFILWSVFVLATGVGVGHFFLPTVQPELTSPLVEGEKVEKTYPLLKYSFSELSQRTPVTSPIELKRVLKKDDEFTSYLFTYTSDGKKISGLMNIPVSTDSAQAYPVILMMRGFVPEEIYEPGVGTSRAGEVFAKQGYITIAPDFLGFGESDPQPGDPLEARFIKPLNVLDLIASVESFHLQPLIFDKEVAGRMDSQRIGIWGHSNGGQIALSVLEITGRSFPTTLWAPVTKPFPYSVLYFTDESEDFGKGLRATLAKFEQEYDIEQFTIGQHQEKITAKIQLHQGTADDAVPVTWSDQFVRNMKKANPEVDLEYYVYPGADHNLQPSWNEVVQKDIQFFNTNVKEKN